MKRIGILIICLIGLLAFPRRGRSDEWIAINPEVFSDRGEAASSFQEAVFDGNYLYVVSSDSNALQSEDPNRVTILWASEVQGDPNEWRDGSQVLWQDAMFDTNTNRVDRVFYADPFVYTGIYTDGNCRLYRFSDPNQSQELTLGQDPNRRTKWRIDHGEIFENRLYIGIYEEAYGIRVLDWNLSGWMIDQEVDVDTFGEADPNTRISLLKHVGERLFLGTSRKGLGALLSYTTDGGNWYLSEQDTFDDPNISNHFSGFLSMAQFMGQGWLLTEFEKGAENHFALWKSGLSEELEWEKQISSLDPNGPFSDPDMVGVSDLQPFGEYLYLACLCNAGGKIWKNYLGEAEEWIHVPSPSDPNTSFDPNNLLMDIFRNPSDLNHIYAGTKNHKGAQILIRWVPRIDILHVAMEDRFVGPEKDSILMKITPNWDDPNHWTDPNHLPEASVFSPTDPNGIKTLVEPVHIDPNGCSLWAFDPNITDKEGMYYLRLESAYGEGNEDVIKYLSFAWDANSPSVPQGVQVVVGDSELKVTWQASSDSLGQMEGLEDPNFSQSLKEYEVAYCRKDDPNEVWTNIPVGNVTENIISGVDNIVLYRIRVRARDKANNVSGWSDEKEKMPQPTLGLLDLLDNSSGCFISTLTSKRKKGRGGRRWLVGLKVGGYEPSSDEADLIYGEDRAWPVQLEIGWVHRRYLEIALGAGYMELDGTGLAVETLEKSMDQLTFRIVPCFMTFRWIPFDYPEQILIPYLGGGINAWWYQEDKPKRENRDGWKSGYHGLLGVRFLLNQFDPEHARVLEKEFGIIRTYLNFEMVYHWIDNFGESRLDLGGAFYQAGILFLF